MENVAAVTFSERYLWRSEPTRADLRGLASVIFARDGAYVVWRYCHHEVVNDLWLNESFATFMASSALYEATTFKEAWQDFFVGDKNWAYWQDSLSTTHPIEAPVHSVKEAFANFDGITYGKGAAVLKQLRAYITPEVSKRGIQTYIKTHAFQNAELTDFIAALQTQTDRNLDTWAKRWLRQSGTDRLTGKVVRQGDRLSQVELITTTLRGC